MKTKKLLAVILSLVMVSGIVTGCTKNENNDSNGKIKVGIAQISDHLSLNTIRESIIAEIKAQGYEDKIEFEYQNAQGEMSNVNTLAQKFVGDKKDLIVAIATPTALGVKNATKTIPIVFSAVTDPIFAKLVTDLQKPTENITGTSDAIPVDKIFELSKQLTPNAKTFGLIYSQSELNSASVIEDVKEYGKANGFTFVEAPITNGSEVQSAAQSLIGRVDAIFTPIDNTVAPSMKILAKVAAENKIPVYTGADSLVMDGGLATYGIDYELLGKQTAQMVIDILFNGKKPSDIPVEVMDNFAPVINKTTADKIGVTIPQELQSMAQIVK